MKWLKSRYKYLNEAKIRDVLLPKQIKKVKDRWGEKYLDYEEVLPTENIEQGKWKLEEEDKMLVFSKFFQCDMKSVFSIFEELSDHFCDALKKSIDMDLLQEKDKVVLDNFDPKKPTIDQIVTLYSPVFRKLSNETKESEMIKRDENGVPERDDENNIIKVPKEPGELVYEKNLVSVNTFLRAYNNYFSDTSPGIGTFNNQNLSNLVNMAKESHNPEYNVDFELFNKDIYLYISHSPKDVLNMSVSTFYASCMQLYSDSGYNSRLLANVFDPNSIPAFLIFDSEIHWKGEKISDNLPLSRLMIRNIDPFDGTIDSKLYFDKCYPDRMEDVLKGLIEKYTKNKEESVSDYYYFNPDIDLSDDLEEPYMDRLAARTGKSIGVNTKILHINREFNWSKIKILPNARVKYLLIDDVSIPEGLLDIKIAPEIIKFRFIEVKDISKFSKIINNKISFDKCKLNIDIINNFENVNKIETLSLVGCDLEGTIDISKFTSLKDFELLYSIDNLEELKMLLPIESVEKSESLKTLTLSGDIVGKEYSEYLNLLKKSGLIIKKKGLLI